MSRALRKSQICEQSVQIDIFIFTTTTDTNIMTATTKMTRYKRPVIIIKTKVIMVNYTYVIG